MNFTVLCGKTQFTYKYSWNGVADLEDVLADLKIQSKVRPKNGEHYALYDANWVEITTLNQMEQSPGRQLFFENIKNAKKPTPGSHQVTKLPNLNASQTSGRSRLSVPTSSLFGTAASSPTASVNLPSLLTSSSNSYRRARSDDAVYRKAKGKKKKKAANKENRQAMSVDRNNNLHSAITTNSTTNSIQSQPVKNNIGMLRENVRRVSAPRKKKKRKKSGGIHVDAAQAVGDPEGKNEGIVPKCKFVIPIDSKGDVVRRYEFDEVIGDGNFAVVSKVLDRRDHSEWAIKEIEKKIVKNKAYYIENEIDLMLRCKHPNICRLREAFDTPDTYFLVMELLNNGDLFDAIKSQGTFAESVTAGVVWDTANALQYLHHYRIVHRDIKPENLLISGDFRVKLGDFGLACKVLGKLKRVAGTPTYVAPEILAEIGYGIPIDIWSLGVIMHIMLVGYAPFRSSKREELFRLIQEGNYSFKMPGWDKISDGAKELVNDMLVVDPNQRVSARKLLRSRWLLRKTIKLRQHDTENGNEE